MFKSEVCLRLAPTFHVLNCIEFCFCSSCFLNIAISEVHVKQRRLKLNRTHNILIHYYLFVPTNAHIYRVSIKSFPDYKNLLQENYVEYK